MPASLKNTTDDTFYTHYSCLSTVEANWGLGSLGRGDTNSTLNNVLDFVASVTGWKNNGISGDSPDIRECAASRIRPSDVHSKLTRIQHC